MIGAHHSSQALRGRAFLILRWIAGLALLLVLAYFLRIEALREALARVPGTRFLVVLTGYLLAYGIGMLKWRMVVNAAGATLNLSTSAQCYFGGLFGDLFLPSIIGGDVVRLSVGLRRSPRPAAVLAGNFADRLLDLTADITLIAGGLVLLPGRSGLDWSMIGRRAVFLVGLLAIAASLLSFGLHRPLLRGRSVRFRRWLGKFRHAFQSVSRRPRVLLAGWMMGLCVQGGFLFMTALLGISCGLVLPLEAWMFAWPLAKIAALVPLTQGGLGVREGALVVLLTPFGALASVVLATGLAAEGVIICAGLLSGLLALLLRQSEETADEDKLS